MSNVLSTAQKPALAGGLSIVPDPWLAAVMSRDVYRVSGSVEQGDEPQAERGIHSITARSGFFYARVPTYDVPTSRLLERCGFHIVDTGITLETSGLPSHGGEAGRTRLARAEDREAVENIARSSFTYSRFHLDPDIPKQLADEIKAQWAGNYFYGQRGDSMVVGERGGQVAGFLQLLNATGEMLVVDLIAVGEGHRGHGLAEEMIRFAAFACGSPKALRAGTQSANIGSLALYQKMGFRIVSTSYVLHHHGPAR
jgi:ribosomal protein S18 acetylase RimI-like enzyme